MEEIVRRLVAALQPEMIYLHGSHAYGEPHEDSDVDCPSCCEEATRSGHEGAVAVYRALRGLCVPAEVQVVTRGKLSVGAQWLSSIERVAKEKGKILYASSAERNTRMASESCYDDLLVARILGDRKPQQLAKLPWQSERKNGIRTCTRQRRV